MKTSDLAKGIFKRTVIEPSAPEEEKVKSEEIPPALEAGEDSEVKIRKKAPAFRLSDFEIFDLPPGPELMENLAPARDLEAHFETPPPEAEPRKGAYDEDKVAPEEPVRKSKKEVFTFRLSELMEEKSRADDDVLALSREEETIKPAGTDGRGERVSEATEEKVGFRPDESSHAREKEEKGAGEPSLPTPETRSLALESIDAPGLFRMAKVYLTDLKERIRSGISIDIEPVAEVIGRIIKEELVTDEITQGIARLGGEEEYYISHAVNTAVYAVRVGRGLKYEFEELRELAMAGFLCDIGLFKIPDEILNKQGKLSSEEISLIKSHTEIARELLSPFASTYPKMIRAVTEHHERENGQGYPRGLKGDEISEFAKIIGICDSYVAMTHNRPHKKALIQTETIRELISMKGNFFSAKIIKAFLDEISIFPVGSYVVLNNKMIGEVVATNRYSPFKPTVKILFDEHGNKFENPRLVDLMKNPVLNIETNISFEDLPGGN